MKALTPSEIYAALQTVGIPAAYGYFPDRPGSPAPAPPFLLYVLENGRPFFADGTVYADIQVLTAELYTTVRDWGLEASVEAAFRALDLPFARDTDTDPKERLHITSYTTEVLIHAQE